MGFFPDRTSPEKCAFGLAALPDRSEHAIAKICQTELRTRMQVLVSASLEGLHGSLSSFIWLSIRVRRRYAQLS